MENYKINIDYKQYIWRLRQNREDETQNYSKEVDWMV